MAIAVDDLKELRAFMVVGSGDTTHRRLIIARSLPRTERVEVYRHALSHVLLGHADRSATITEWPLGAQGWNTELESERKQHRDAEEATRLLELVRMAPDGRRRGRARDRCLALGMTDQALRRALRELPGSGSELGRFAILRGPLLRPATARILRKVLRFVRHAYYGSPAPHLFRRSGSTIRQAGAALVVAEVTLIARRRERDFASSRAPRPQTH